jgi:large conductance mechanosensitive channel
MKGFKEFILKGNVVDLAVGIVIGVSFGGVVTALVKDLITPLIAVVGGTPDFSALSFTIGKSKFLVGDFINALLSFLINAAVIYFFVVVPMGKLTALAKKEKPASPNTKKCPYCLSDVPVGAKRCAFCTSSI